MKCETALQLLDNYIDQDLPDSVTELEAHLAGCHQCKRELQQRRALISELQNLPVPEMHPAFAANVFRNTRHRASQRRNFVAGFASAIAATLVIWLTVNNMQPIETGNHPVNTLKLVALQVEETRAISLAFNAPENLQNVSFKLELPAGVELVNRPKQQQLAWQDRLQRGRNVLQLNLVGKRDAQGVLIASIEHDGKKKVFHIPLSVTSNSDAGASSLDTAVMLPV